MEILDKSLGQETVYLRVGITIIAVLWRTQHKGLLCVSIGSLDDDLS